MNITDMHIMFRQYAQQMGMQNVRAITPEQTDVLLNAVISDITNQLVRSNSDIRNEGVNDNNKIAQINSLRSLYSIKEYRLTTPNAVMELISSNASLGKMTSTSKFDVEDVLYVVDIAIQYKKGVITGYSGDDRHSESFADNSEETNYFPVRFVEESYLANTINDSILKHKITSPIVVVHDDLQFDLYIDKFIKTDTYRLKHDILPYKLKFSYIRKPIKVSYKDGIDCDLPESLHVDIVKGAVDLYTTSIQRGLYNSQQNSQQSQQQTNKHNQ